MSQSNPQNESRWPLRVAQRRKGFSNLMLTYPRTSRQSTTESDHLVGHQPQLFRSQTDRVIALLLEHRGHEVPAPELAKIGLQYASRIWSARRAGYIIENRIERVNGQIHGFYKLTACPGESAVSNSNLDTVPVAASEERETGDQPSPEGKQLTIFRTRGEAL